ncbi:MAG TPA: phospho-N-acetylmuramoyl-pentapeptide-transferase, partial [Methyloceanibacter sp.]|nr:phospho-N-acetylmuramoyl-pentapeptide-transferase [Methyloceanibacter sp.]
MLYWLAQFAPELSVFNVFRYITFRTGGALITALLFVFLFGPRVIRSLRIRQGKGQPIRKDGPERHVIQKQGTPTMGGLMILSGVTVAVLLWGNLENMFVLVVLLLTLVYGAVGLYDDYLKVTKQSAEGFRGRIKIVIEAFAAVAATVAIVHASQEPLATSLTIPFFKGTLINLGWLYILFGAFIIVGAGNAVNLTDGLDGLAIVPVMIAAATFGFISYLVGNALFADYLQIHFVAGT